MEKEQKTTATWLERVEEIVGVLEGSSVGELELTEGDTAIVIRRSPGMVLTAAPTLPTGMIVQGEVPGAAIAPRAPQAAERTIPIVAPLTGVYYASASPSSPPFVNPGDMVNVGQTIALVEAMKVFNEINAEVTGRVVSIVATTGSVVQKGDVILRVDPL